MQMTLCIYLCDNWFFIHMPSSKLVADTPEYYRALNAVYRRNKLQLLEEFRKNLQRFVRIDRESRQASRRYKQVKK